MDEPSLKGILTSAIVAKVFIKIFNNSECLLTWPKLLLTDMGSEFKGSCKKLMKEHGVKIQKASSKSSIGIVERFNQTLAKKLFRIQDAQELLLPLPKRSRAWVKNLPIIINNLNNSVTWLLGITLNEAIKKKFVYAKASKPRYGPIGYNEIRLTYNDPVLYLLKPSELKGGRRHATDINWSLQIYYIHESLVQKNQPVLYWIEDINENGPKRSFVREELQIIHPNTELLP
ncbi:22498_t:CDS:1 [Cetraspora pellucida]|uniref:22498_t:CDS:1 n=1 Tax=Cetraspora pellucida TaxID=1433469 RepID=A0A9N8ZPR4_9GLOM|nr:22498_t:CDS:1 [Cetraspora pellucida]